MLLEKQPLSKPILDFSIGVVPNFLCAIFNCGPFYRHNICLFFFDGIFFHLFLILDKPVFSFFFFALPGLSKVFHRPLTLSTMQKFVAFSLFIISQYGK
jgi:hypothetical protein